MKKNERTFFIIKFIYILLIVFGLSPLAFWVSLNYIDYLWHIPYKWSYFQVLGASSLFMTIHDGSKLIQNRIRGSLQGLNICITEVLRDE